MIIVLFMMLAMTSSSFVSSSRPQPLEQVMRDTLKHVMKCPEWPIDDDIQQPIAAFSPARYMQLVATVRKDSRENSCGRKTHLRFDLQDPDSWNFCAMGICSEESCSCFKNFIGKKCNKFEGHCWLFYCWLSGCNTEAPSLYCSCNPSLYGTPVVRRIYFYDHGFESSYLPPPHGFVTNAFVDSHLIRQTSPGHYEIIGGNYYRGNNEIRASNMKYDKKRYRYDLQRLNFDKPVQQFGEQFFDGKYPFNNNPKYIQKDIYRNYPATESSRNLIAPDYSGQLHFRNSPYSSSNSFYNSKVYKSNSETGSIADSEILQPFPVVPEDGYRKNYNNPSIRDVSYVAPWRTDRIQRTNMQIHPKNNLRNSNNLDSQYKAVKLINKWPGVKNKLPYLPKKIGRIDHSNTNNWYRRNSHFNKEFINNNEERGIFNDDGLYRVNREKFLEDTTIEIVADENAYDESDDIEDFKFTSRSQNRFLFFHPVFCIISFVLCFL